MKSKKGLPLISLLFVAIMLFSVGMIAKEYRERQQDIKGFGIVSAVASVGASASQRSPLETRTPTSFAFVSTNEYRRKTGSV